MNQFKIGDKVRTERNGRFVYGVVTTLYPYSPNMCAVQLLHETNRRGMMLQELTLISEEDYLRAIILNSAGATT